MDKNHPNSKDPRPKRRRDNDNPYEIFSVGRDTDCPHYYTSFLDHMGVRICVEISKELFGNRHSPTTIVAAVSTQIQGKAELPTHYHLTGGCCLKQPSIVLLEQLRTIDTHRLGKRIGALSREDIAAMDQALKISVGLNNAYNRKE